MSDKTKMNLKIEWEGVDWIHLAQDRDRWLTPVNMIKNLHVPENEENSFIASRIISCLKDSASRI